MYVASQNGYLRVVQALVEASADMDNATVQGGTPLGVASHGGHRDIVSFLCDSRADVAVQRNTDGMTPLMAAATPAQVEVVMKLLDVVDMEQPDKKGQTALFKAVQKGHLEVVRVLCESGACKNLADSHGVTPEQESAQPEMRSLLSETGLSIVLREATGTNSGCDVLLERPAGDLRFELSGPGETSGLDLGLDATRRLFGGSGGGFIVRHAAMRRSPLDEWEQVSLRLCLLSSRVRFAPRLPQMEAWPGDGELKSFALTALNEARTEAGCGGPLGLAANFPLLSVRTDVISRAAALQLQLQLCAMQADEVGKEAACRRGAPTFTTLVALEVMPRWDRIKAMDQMWSGVSGLIHTLSTTYHRYVFLVPCRNVHMVIKGCYLLQTTTPRQI